MPRGNRLPERLRLYYLDPGCSMKNERHQATLLMTSGVAGFKASGVCPTAPIAPLLGSNVRSLP